MNAGVQLDDALLHARLEVIHDEACPQGRLRKPPVKPVLVAIEGRDALPKAAKHHELPRRHRIRGLARLLGLARLCRARILLLLCRALVATQAAHYT